MTWGALAASSAAAAPPSVGLPIIVYHQIRNTVDGPPDSLEAISLARFSDEMRYLHEHGFVTLSAGEVVDFMRTGKAPGQRIVAIHFDDGWKSAQLALPVLDSYGFKATFWIIAGKGIGWPHMDWAEIEAIARNPRYDVYSHSMTHPWKPGDTMLDWINGRTPGKDAADVAWELTESRKVLAERLGRAIPYLAWPAGHFDPAMIRLAVEAGYTALFTVNDGINGAGGDILRIRRTMVHGGCDAPTFAAILHDGKYRECLPGTPPREVPARMGG